jgi:hypothetical protein
MTAARVQSFFMKDGILNIVGKQITGLFIAEAGSGAKPDRTHVFLAFSDNTYFELWATSDCPGYMGACSDLDRGGMKEIKDYARGMRVIFELDMH